MITDKLLLIIESGHYIIATFHLKCGIENTSLLNYIREKSGDSLLPKIIIASLFYPCM